MLIQLYKLYLKIIQRLIVIYTFETIIHIITQRKTIISSYSTKDSPKNTNAQITLNINIIIIVLGFYGFIYYINLKLAIFNFNFFIIFQGIFPKEIYLYFIVDYRSSINLEILMKQ